MTSLSGRRDLPVEERFNRSYTVDSKGCWIWSAYLNAKRRPVISIRGVQVYAHRYSYERYRGLIPKGIEVCHSCDVTECVNPNHLFLGTHQDNMDDMVSKDRANKPKGSLNGRAKLTESDIVFIRTMYRPRHKEYSQLALARRFNVCVVTIQEILYRKKWAHVP